MSKDGGREQAPVDRFCDRVRADRALTDALLQPDDGEQFVALAATVARNCGFALDAIEIRQAMRGNLREMEPFDPGDQETPLPPAGWLPTVTFWRGRQLYVQWSFAGTRRLTQPFFEDDVQIGMRKPFNRLIRYTTPIERLREWVRSNPPLQLNGFIFHMSRCGSTLVSQMLAALPHNRVISEASPIDAVVSAKQMRPDLDDDEHAIWLRSIVGALGQPRAATERNYFIKLDCWHTVALPLFARAFPAVPWIFLYRDPVEVLVSHQQMPGAQMIPGGIGRDLFGIDVSSAIASQADYHSRVLAGICEPVLRSAGNKGMLVNYRQLPEALWSSILPHFGVASSEQDRTTMTEAARYDAKMPGTEFTADSETKQRKAAAIGPVRAAAEKYLSSIYRQLEAARTGGNS